MNGLLKIKTCFLITFSFSILFVNAQWTHLTEPFGGRINTLIKIGTAWFAGTDNAGVFISYNGGANWTSSNNGIQAPLKINKLYYHSSILYAATETGLYKSTNLGSSWQLIYGAYSTSFYIMPSGEWYLGTLWNGLRGSIDSGSTWSFPGSVTVNAIDGNGIEMFSAMEDGNLLHGSSSEFLAPFPMKSVAVHDSIIYAGSAGGAIYSSFDNGGNWNTFNFSLDLSINCLSTNGASVLAGTNRYLFYSSDYGVSWDTISTGLKAPDIICAVLDSPDIYVGTVGNSVFYSHDLGTTWTKGFAGIEKNTYVSNISFTPTGLFTGIKEGQATRSTNQGLNWDTLSQSLFGNTVTGVIQIGSQFMASTLDSGIYISNDGINWTLSLYQQFHYHFTCLHANGNTIFAGTDDGIYITSNFGQSWLYRLINVHISSIGNVGNTIFVGGGFGALDLVWQSVNNGLNWNSIISSYSGDYVANIKNQDSIVYIASRNHLRVSTDGGTIWNTNAYITPDVTDLLVINDSCLFVSTVNGVLFSSDRGHNFARSDPDEFDYFNCLATDGTKIYAGTEGVGIFCSDLASIVPLNVKNFDNEVTQINISPNPITEQFKIKLYTTSDRGKFEVSIVEINGSIVKNLGEFKKDKNYSVQNIKPGNYFLRVVDQVKGKSYQTRIIIL